MDMTYKKIIEEESDNANKLKEQNIPKEAGRIILASHGFNCGIERNSIERAMVEAFESTYKTQVSDQTIALFTMSEYEISELLRSVAVELGFKDGNIQIWDEHIPDHVKRGKKAYDWCYVSEGNTFEICNMLRLTGGEGIIKQSMDNGGSYIGASAGVMLASSSIEFAGHFEQNIVGINDFHDFGILPKELGRTMIIPHYTKRQFERYKRNTPKWKLEKYDYITYIPNTGYIIFVSDFVG